MFSRPMNATPGGKQYVSGLPLCGSLPRGLPRRACGGTGLLLSGVRQFYPHDNQGQDFQASEVLKTRPREGRLLLSEKVLATTLVIARSRRLLSYGNRLCRKSRLRYCAPHTLVQLKPHILPEDILKPPCPRCVERGRDARKSDDATNVAEE